MTFGWTPSQQVTYKGTTNSEKTFYPGKVYSGIPYMSVHFCSIYTAADYCDPDNGGMDLSGGAETIDLFANQCSSSMFWAYAWVCNSVTYRFTWGVLEKNGCLRVGDLKLEKMAALIPTKAARREVDRFFEKRHQENHKSSNSKKTGKVDEQLSMFDN